MKTHDNQKPFQCTVCNRGYSTAAALTSHMQNHHKRAAERANSPQISGPSYKCLQCTQIFRKPDELQVGTLLSETFLLRPALLGPPSDISKTRLPEICYEYDIFVCNVQMDAGTSNLDCQKNYRTAF